MDKKSILYLLSILAVALFLSLILGRPGSVYEGATSKQEKEAAEKAAPAAAERAAPAAAERAAPAAAERAAPAAAEKAAPAAAERAAPAAAEKAAPAAAEKAAPAAAEKAAPAAAKTAVDTALKKVADDAAAKKAADDAANKIKIDEIVNHYKNMIREAAFASVDDIRGLRLSSEDPVQQEISDIRQNGSRDGYIAAMHRIVDLLNGGERAYDNKTIELYAIAKNYKKTIKQFAVSHINGIRDLKLPSDDPIQKELFTIGTDGNGAVRAMNNVVNLVRYGVY